MPLLPKPPNSKRSRNVPRLPAANLFLRDALFSPGEGSGLVQPIVAISLREMKGVSAITASTRSTAFPHAEHEGYNYLAHYAGRATT